MFPKKPVAVGLSVLKCKFRVETTEVVISGAGKVSADHLMSTVDVKIERNDYEYHPHTQF